MVLPEILKTIGSRSPKKEADKEEGGGGGAEEEAPHIVRIN